MQTTRAAEWQRCMASYESLRLNNLMTLNFYGLIPAAVRTFKRVLFLNDCEWKILSEFNSSANPNVAKLLWIFHFTGKRTRRMVIVNTLLNVKHLNSDLNHRKLRVLPSWYLHIVIMLLNLRLPRCFIPFRTLFIPFSKTFFGEIFRPSHKNKWRTNLPNSFQASTCHAVVQLWKSSSNQCLKRVIPFAELGKWSSGINLIAHFAELLIISNILRNFSAFPRKSAPENKNTEKVGKVRTISSSSCAFRFDLLKVP